MQLTLARSTLMRSAREMVDPLCVHTVERNTRPKAWVAPFGVAERLLHRPGSISSEV